MIEIVAEIGASHNGKLENALTLIKSAKDAGADAVKLQTFEPEEMAIPGYAIKHGPWKGMELVELYRQAHTPKAWHETLFNYAYDLEIKIFSAPFSRSDVDFLETLNCPRYKIASYEACDFQLVDYVAQTGKPMVISTGQLNKVELFEMIQVILLANGGADVTLLECVSEYPALETAYDISSMESYAEYGNYGISDHTPGVALAEMAESWGVAMLEKHIKLDGDKTGLDSRFAVDQDQFAKYVQIARNPPERLRKSLYYSQNLPAGTILNSTHFKTARPALGAAPYRIGEFIGTTLTRSVKMNEPVR